MCRITCFRNQFVVNATGHGAMNMDELNAKALFVERLLPDRPTLLEVTYERLLVLARRDDSCLLRSGIFPAIKCVKDKLLRFANLLIVVFVNNVT